MIKVWSIPTRLMHWTLTSAFIVAFFTHSSEALREVHVTAGYVVGGVIVLRWLYGFLLRDFSSFRRFPPSPMAAYRYLASMHKGSARRYLGHNPAGAIAIYVMLLVGMLTVITGFMAYMEVDLPFNLFPDDLHGVIAYTLTGIICVHLIGVIASSLYHKENLPLAMITGKKKRKKSQVRVSLLDPELVIPIQNNQHEEDVELVMKRKRWICYEDSTVFIVEADTKEEAERFAELYDGYVAGPENGGLYDTPIYYVNVTSGQL
jgi:cytochrome b